MATSAMGSQESSEYSTLLRPYLKTQGKKNGESPCTCALILRGRSASRRRCNWSIFSGSGIRLVDILDSADAPEEALTVGHIS